VEIGRGVGPTTLAQSLLRTRPRVAFATAADVAVLSPAFAEGGVESVFVVDDPPPGAGTWRLLGDRGAGFIGDDGRLDEDLPAIGRGEATLRRALRDDALHPAAMACDDVDSAALVLFTSGSTGDPVGVVLTHRNLGNARQIVAALQVRSEDRAMLVLPLSYSYGRSVLHTQLLAGGATFLEHRFSYPRVVVSTMQREGSTIFAGVPLTYEVLRRHYAAEVVPVPTLRQVTQAGGAMTTEARAWVRRAFPGVDFHVMYGATEATARLTVMPAARSAEKDGSIGIPIPGVRLRIVDDAGCDTPAGGIGQLIAAGDNISPGYLDDDARTAMTFRDGWLWTGDLARRDDDGYYYVVGRAREMMKVGGRRASPRTVEDVVLAHPAVSDCVACGVADALTGEAVAVAIVVRAGHHVDADALRRFCRSRLPAWLVPRVVELLDRLPRGAHGKVQRGLVAEQLRRRVAAAHGPDDQPLVGAPFGTQGERPRTDSASTAPGAPRERSTRPAAMPSPQPGDHR
jgi:acyl-CoA synthetase (AMP-forming)/AMP-acid ligase II